MIDVLAHTAVFRGIPFEGMAQLVERGRLRVFAVGTPLMRQSEMGDTMHIILSGLVRVERAHPQLQEPLRMADLGPGEVIGAMGFLDQAPRAATVTALETTETVEFDARTVAEVFQRYPEVAATLLGMFSQRFRTTDELAAAVLGSTSRATHAG
jgi:CRP/FNR family transcriptional regulator